MGFEFQKHGGMKMKVSKLCVTVLMFWTGWLYASANTIVSSSNNITTAYGSGAGSQVLSGLNNVNIVTVQNDTATAIEVSWGLATCTSGQASQMYVLPYSNNTKDLKAPIKGAICIKSTSGTISSGTVYAETL